MAIQKTVMTKFGIEVENAYHRVSSLFIQPKDKLRFTLKSYKNVENYPFDEQQYMCEYNPSGANAHQQAYAYVKTLDEFSNATDC